MGVVTTLQSCCFSVVGKTKALIAVSFVLFQCLLKHIVVFSTCLRLINVSGVSVVLFRMPLKMGFVLLTLSSVVNEHGFDLCSGTLFFFVFIISDKSLL